MSYQAKLDKATSASGFKFTDINDHSNVKTNATVLSSLKTSDLNFKLFEELINRSISNILSKNITDGDTGITGPKLFGKVSQKLFNYLEKGSEFQINGLKVKIITYCLNLPLPEGSWLKSSFKTSITSNALITYCKSKSGKIYKNNIYFLPGDILSNNDGRIIGNTSVTFSLSDGSGFYIYNNKIWCISKYTGYNEERHLLGGNDFAIMFQKNEIFTDSF
jgi:hypothetical protein